MPEGLAHELPIPQAARELMGGLTFSREEQLVLDVIHDRCLGASAVLYHRRLSYELNESEATRVVMEQLQADVGDGEHEEIIALISSNKLTARWLESIANAVSYPRIEQSERIRLAIKKLRHYGVSWRALAFWELSLLKSNDDEQLALLELAHLMEEFA